MERVLKVTVDADIPFIKGVLEPYAEVRYLKGVEIEHSAIVDSDALIIRTRTKCTPALLNGTSVKFIASATVGNDHIDTEWCRSNGICVTNAAGCNSWGVVQYVLTAIIYLCNKKGFTLSDKSVGIIGAGNIGEKLAQLMERFNIKVLRCDPPLELIYGKGYYNIDEVLVNSDIVTLHVPLDDTTNRMASEDFFAKMKRDALFINSSRGEVVDETALIKAMQKLGGVVLDVWNNEPLISKELLSLVDIGTPHIAGYSIEGKMNATLYSLRSFGKYFNISELKELSLDYPKPPHYNLVKEFYDIERDSSLLKERPSLFEEFRNRYSYRYEYSDTIIDLFEMLIKGRYV